MNERESGSATSKRSISAIVTCCDSERFIDAMLASLHAQSRQPDEVIVHDAASTDATVDRVRRWNDRLPIELVTSAQRTSPGRSRARAIDRAKGELIATLDHDDYLTPDHLSVLDSLLVGPGTVAVPRALMWRPTISLEPLDQHWREPFPAQAEQLKVLAWRNFVFGQVVMYRADYEAAGGYPDLSQVEDWELWIRMALTGVRFSRPEIATILYRRGHDSVSQREALTRVAEVDMLSRYADQFRVELGSKGWATAQKHYAHRYDWVDAYDALERGDWGGAQSLARAAVRANRSGERRLAAVAVLPQPVVQRLFGAKRGRRG